ncbi:MAG: hypothetical protein JSS60_08845 [Verrucomicrobia bacterium]|nr:hypothetical protein [Verrucomicrobiota bacterium]
MKKHFFSILLLTFSITQSYALGSAISASRNQMDEAAEKLAAPAWMYAQLDRDFAPYKEKTISLQAMNDFFTARASDLQLAKITIFNNNVSAATSSPPHKNTANPRLESYLSAFRKLCSHLPMPNVTFLISLHDGIDSSVKTSKEIPLFVMCKTGQIENGFLIPDFDALMNGFQVLAKADITQFEQPWETKAPSLIWRGSTAYGNIILNKSNLHLNYRVKLCQISKNYPQLIDAKFTIYAQGGQKVLSIRNLKGKKVSFENQLNYKYHILIDGNASSYSSSGWKFFTNSLIFKPDSPWFQWYYNDLKPWIHYVPVRTDLEDLVEKVQWAQTHDLEAKIIAANARQFALEHISEHLNLSYLYLAILRYSQLNFE